MAKNNDKLWDGRFSEANDAFVEAFTASVEFDKTLALYDIQGSVAHATMLTRVGVITEEELQSIEAGLKEIGEEIKTGSFNWSIALEDVHMNIESALTERIGGLAKNCIPAVPVMIRSLLIYVSI